MNFRLKFWHHHSIPWSQFPYRARYFGDTRKFSDDFCIGYTECPPYFYFRSSWPTDLESVSRDAHLAVIRWYDHPLPRYSVITADTLRDLDLWPFNVGQWPYMAGHVVNPSTKFEDPTAIRSSVMRQRMVVSTSNLVETVTARCASRDTLSRSVGQLERK